MITFEEALKIIDSVNVASSAGQVSIIESLGRVLASDVYSDIDMPPFDKSAVDGFACRRSDLPGPLKVISTIAAGDIPEFKIAHSQCSKIMTGAIVPEGADCVIMIESVRINSDGTISFEKATTSNNIAYRAEDVKYGQKILEKGTTIKPQHIAMMAAVGCVKPEVYNLPTIGILTTGDELVEPDEIPSYGKIRNSNAYQLIAQAKQMGIEAKYMGISHDNVEDTRLLIAESLVKCDILLITGGVSMGDFDYVPSVIESLGLNVRFRSVAVQPGKPTLFAENAGKFIFGLPGNPVSSFVQFEMMVKPLLYRMMGTEFKPRIVKLPMATGYTRKRTDRKSFIPVRYSLGKIEPVEYHGSAHINAFEDAWGVISIGIGEDNVKPGELRDVRQF